MKNKKQLEEVLNQLDNPDVIRAVIIGNLQRTFNKVQVGKYNKLAIDFDLEKETLASLKELILEMGEDDELNKVYLASSRGEIDLDDLRKEFGKDNDNVFDVLSPYVVENTAVLARNREFSKLQREGAYLDHLISGMKDGLLKEWSGKKAFRYLNPMIKAKKEESDRELLLCLSDWHIGALVNNMDTGGYNFDIFNKRLEKMLEETLRVAKEQGIKRIHVYHIGDIIEHINMRNVNQAFEAEFPATEQIAKGVRVVADVVNTLAGYGFDVTFGMVGGNHDRFQGNKNDKIHNDNVAYLVIDQLIFLQELGAIDPDVELIDNRSDVYSFKDTVAGKRIKVTHGDNEGKKVDVKIPKHIKDEVIDYLIMGHIHTTRIIQEDFSRFHVYVGSPMGANNYSAENNLPTTSPAQLLMVLDKNHNTPQFMPVFL